MDIRCIKTSRPTPKLPVQLRECHLDKVVWGHEPVSSVVNGRIATSTQTLINNELGTLCSGSIPSEVHSCHIAAAIASTVLVVPVMVAIGIET